MAKLKDEDLRLNVIINGDNARKEMGKLERSITDTEIKIQSLLIKQKEMKAASQGSSKAYQDLSKEIQININKNKESKIKLDTLSRSQKLGTMTVKDLRRNVKLLNEELSKTDPNSKQWDVVNSKLKVTKARLAELTAQSRETTGVLKNMSTRFNDYAGMAAASVASFAFVVTGINKCRTSFAEYDETLVDTMKTTNLSREDVEKLSKSLSTLNTRTAQNELLNLARVGGKLGITNLTKIEEFVRAADVINVALSEDLGGNAEDAIREIGKLVDIFKIEDEFGLEKGMLKIASAINDLGMASTANEGYLVSFSKRVAGIAPNADISIQDVLGLAGTLDSLGQMAETAGTAYGQAITGMYQDTESFAKVAGMTEVAFEKLLEVDANEAFVRVLEGMNASEVGMRGVLEAMDSLNFDGQQVVQVLGSLASQTDELRRQQDIASESFATGTSAMDEFDKKNNSVTATIEKNKKALEAQSLILGEKLNPLINFSVSSFTYFVKILGATITLTTKYSGLIIALTALMLAMNAQTTYSNTLAKIRNFWSIANIALIKSEILGMTGATSATYLFAAAKAILTGNIIAAGVAMKGFFLAMGPVGWIITGIGLLAGSYYTLRDSISDTVKESDKLNDARKKADKEYNDEALQIQVLSDIINDATVAVTARRKAIEDLKKIIPSYNATLNDECVLTNNNTEAIKAYLTQLEREIKTKGIRTDLESAWAEKRRIEAELKNKNKELDSTPITIQTPTGEFSNPKLPFLELSIKLDEKSLEGVESVIYDLKKEVTAIAQAPESGKKNGSSNLVIDSKTDWSLSEDETFLKSRLALKLKFNQGGIASEEEYSKQLLALEVKSLHSRLVLNLENGPERLKLQEQLADKLLQQKKQKLQEVEDVDKLIAGNEKDKVKIELARYEAEKKKYVGNKKALLALETKHHQNMMQLQFNTFNASIKRKEDRYRIDRDLMVKAHKDELTIFKGSRLEKKSIQARHIQELQDLDKAHFSELAKLLKTVSSSAESGGLEIDFSLLSEEEKLNILDRLEEVQKKLGNIGFVTSDIGYSLFNSEGCLFGITEDDWETFFDNVGEGKIGFEEIALAVQAAAALGNELIGIFSANDRKQTAIENNQLKEYHKNNDKKKKVLSDRLDSGLITQAEYDAQVQAMEDEYNVKKEEFEIAQANRKKKSDIASATINMAVGITKTLAEWGLPWGLIPAGIVAAMGAAQIALIQSTPIVSGAEDGGSIFERAQDGKQFNAKLSPDKRGFISKPTVIVGENGSEYVIPNEGLQNQSLAPFIATIEAARRTGNLKSLDFRAIYPVDSVMGRELGGLTQPANFKPTSVQSDIPISSDQLTSQLLQVLEQLGYQVERLDNKLDEPSRAYVTLLGDGGILEAMKQYERNRKNGKL